MQGSIYLSLVHNVPEQVVSGLYLVPYPEEKLQMHYPKNGWNRFLFMLMWIKSFSGHNLKEAFKQGGTSPLTTSRYYVIILFVKKCFLFFLYKKSLEILTVAAR